MNNEVIALCSLDVELYKCVTADIATAGLFLLKSLQSISQIFTRKYITVSLWI